MTESAYLASHHRQAERASAACPLGNTPRRICQSVAESDSNPHRLTSKQSREREDRKPCINMSVSMTTAGGVGGKSLSRAVAATACSVAWRRLTYRTVSFRTS